MMRAPIFCISYGLDWLVGDPEWLPHPVRVIGWSIRSAEKLARRIGSGKRFEFVTGSVIAVAIPAASMVLTSAMIRRMYACGSIAGVGAEAWLAASCLATRDLLNEARHVLSALEVGDLSRARFRLARVVGRDTETLDASEICRAVVETLAESLSDGVIAPLLYLAVGGPPLAMAYKAVNTLDSMIGHRDERYLYFGRVAARVDDAANWIPARIAALLLCVAAASCHKTHGRRAVRIWLRDGAQHASPNAGQVESAMAGALGVRLGGENHYDGERIVSPYLGGEFPAARLAAAHRAVKLVAVASLVGFAVTLLILQRSRNA